MRRPVSACGHPLVYGGRHGLMEAAVRERILHAANKLKSTRAYFSGPAKIAEIKRAGQQAFTPRDAVQTEGIHYWSAPDRGRPPAMRLNHARLTLPDVVFVDVGEYHVSIWLKTRRTVPLMSKTARC